MNRYLKWIKCSLVFESKVRINFAAGENELKRNIYLLTFINTACESPASNLKVSREVPLED
jgi:hypothetical protein